jgi:flagella basal body P-ring formation protein FlgA
MARATFDAAQPLRRIVMRHTAAWLVCAVAAACAMPAAHAQEAGGPIVIPGPGEKDSPDLARMTALATGAGSSGSRARAANPAAQAGLAPAPSASAGTRDRFDALANASGAIVIPGTGEAAARPAVVTAAPVMQTAPASRPSGAGLQRVNLNASFAASQVMPVVVTATPARMPNTAAARPVDAAAASDIEIDSLASRGEPPELGTGTTSASSTPGTPRRTQTLPAPLALSPAALAEAAQRAQAIQQMRPALAAQAQQTAAAPVIQTIPAKQPALAARPAQMAQTGQLAQIAQPNRAMAAPQPVQPASEPVPAGQEDGELIHTAALEFLKQQVDGLPGRVELTVAPAFPRGLAACATLQPFLPNNARLWGRTTIGVRCTSGHPWTVWLQAKVSVHATYYVAARAIAPGEVVAEADLVGRDGDLTMLPMSIITAPSQAVGSITLMRVGAGLPLRQDMLKSAASVTAGATVRVVAQGDGFSISSEGSALSNAPPGQPVRVRTAAGQIIMGIVKDSGTVQIQM